MEKRLLSFLTLVIGLAFVFSASTTALGEEFYKGKTLRFVVGYSPGGGYDTYTRAAARHIGRFIPGNPVPIVQNMTGAGSLIAANYIYKRAKPDGLTIGVWNGGLVLQQALGSRGIRFKGDKFGWIGSPIRGAPACAIMGHTGLKTFKDVLKSKKRLNMGATRAGSTTDDLPRILNKTMGTKFKVISGYKGTAMIRIGLLKKELDGVCFGWESMRVTARGMLDSKGDEKLIPFIIHGRAVDAEVKDLPRIAQVIKGRSNLDTFKAWVVPYEFQRPLTLPPGTPKERLNILRKAYDAVMKDPQFLADAKKSKLIINYVTGEEIDGLVAQLLGISSKAKESLQFLVKKSKKKKK